MIDRPSSFAISPGLLSARGGAYRLWPHVQTIVNNAAIAAAHGLPISYFRLHQLKPLATLKNKQRKICPDKAPFPHVVHGIPGPDFT